jgi:hypothetical protein
LETSLLNGLAKAPELEKISRSHSKTHWKDGLRKVSFHITGFSA